jgi:hypothetical protein
MKVARIHVLNAEVADEGRLLEMLSWKMARVIYRSFQVIGPTNSRIGPLKRSCSQATAGDPSIVRTRTTRLHELQWHDLPPE